MSRGGTLDPQPAAQRRREPHAPFDARGVAGLDHHADPRHRGTVRLDRRAGGEEGAAAARQGDLQPVLRELDPHADDVRDRRQTPFRRRHQPEHRRIVDVEGRDAARHRRQPGRDERRHVRRAAFAVRRAAPDRVASQRQRPHPRARRERGRRPACASVAGLARPVHDPPFQAGLPQPVGRDRR